MWRQIKDILKILFFKWWCIFTTPLVILLVKVGYVFYVVALFGAWCNYLYVIKFKHGNVKIWLGINTNVNPRERNNTARTLFKYIYITKPKLHLLLVLKTTKTIKNLKVTQWIELSKILTKFLIWIVWAAITSLPKNVLLASLASLKILKRVYNAKWRWRDKFNYEINTLINSEILKYIDQSDLNFTDELTWNYTQNISTLIKSEWLHIFCQIIYSAKYHYYEIYIIHNFVPSMGKNVWCDFLKKNLNLVYIHQVISLDGVFFSCVFKKKT